MDHPGTDGGPRTESELDRALERVLVGAATNGVDVTGGWEVDPAHPEVDWDVHIARVEDTDGP